MLTFHCRARRFCRDRPGLVRHRRLATGRVVSKRGATYPVDYEYDGFGDRVAMATYRDAALAQGDVTLWLRDEATGLVTNKVYADGAGPTYAYTPDGRLALRTWARGVSTSYAYDGAGNLVSTTYSDDTPSIACAYDRSGNIVSAVTDGVATNLYAYSVEGLVTNEVQNGATLARSYDSLGRPTGYTLRASASLREISCSYDSLGRLFTVATTPSAASSPWPPARGLKGSDPSVYA